MLSILRHFHKHKGRPTDLDQSGHENDQSRAPNALSADSLLRRIPPVKDRILVVPIEKADCSGKWHKRRAILTSSSLILAREDDEYALEEIQLELILEIQMVKAADVIGSQTRFRPETGSQLNRQDRINNGRKQLGKADGETSALKRMRSSFSPNSSRNVINLQEPDGIEYLFDITARIEELESVSKYHLRVSNKQDLDTLIRSLRQAKERFLANRPGTSSLKKLQGRLATFYDEYNSWGVMAALIFINFFIDVVQAEMQPLPDSAAARAPFCAIFCMLHFAPFFGDLGLRLCKKISRKDFLLYFLSSFRTAVYCLANKYIAYVLSIRMRSRQLIKAITTTSKTNLYFGKILLSICDVLLSIRDSSVAN